MKLGSRLALVVVLLAAAPGDFRVDRSMKQWTTASSSGDGSVFTFRGSRIGDAHEARGCWGTPASGTCVVDQFGARACRDLSISVTKDKPPSLGILEVDGLTWRYLDEKLAGFDVAVRVKHFDAFRALLVARYGTPTDTTQVSVQNSMGAEWLRPVDSWRTPNGLMSLVGAVGTEESVALIMRRDGYEAELVGRLQSWAATHADECF